MDPRAAISAPNVVQGENLREGTGLLQQPLCGSNGPQSKARSVFGRMLEGNPVDSAIPVNAVGAGNPRKANGVNWNLFVPPRLQIASQGEGGPTGRITLPVWWVSVMDGSNP